tara:strand:- start:3727 stop:8481 length:4755 start_codon:yes stop_codon:yes gene_type:complete
MPIEKKNAGFPFLTGRNSTPGKKSEIIGQLAEAKELKCENTGELSSRYGFAEEGNTVPAISGIQSEGYVGKGSTLITTEDEVIILDGVNSYAKGKDDLWVKRGVVKACEYEQSRIESSPKGTSGKPAFATANGLEVHVWVEQPYDVETFPSSTVNTDEDIYRLKPASMYYKITGRKTNAVIIPKTKIEDMEVVLRAAGQWSVNGAFNTDGTLRAGPIVSISNESNLNNESTSGNICILRADGAAPDMASNLMQEAFPFESIATPNSAGVGQTGNWHWRKWNELQHVSMFVDYSKGANSNFYQMKPQLFVSPSEDFMVLLYANGLNPEVSATAYQKSGEWRLFYRTIDLRSGVAEFSDALPLPLITPIMDRVFPTWDADYCFDSVDHASAGCIGFAVSFKTPNSDLHQWPASIYVGDSVFISTYKAEIVGTGIDLTQERSEDLTANLGLRVDGTSPNVMKKTHLATNFKVWQSRTSNAPDMNPVVCQLILKGVNRHDTSGSRNRLAADDSNKLVLFANASNKSTAPMASYKGLSYIVMDTKALNPDFYHLLDSSSPPPNLPSLSGLVYADVSVAQPKVWASSASFSTSVKALVEIVNVNSGQHWDVDLGTTSNPSWILNLELTNTAKTVLFKNVGIVSDGVINPRRASSGEAYFTLTYSGQPTTDYSSDIDGRTCVVDWTGRIVSVWEVSSYSTTSDSSWYSTGSQDKLNNNTCLRGLRSRLCFRDEVQLGDMEFGGNSYDPNIQSRRYKWMIPTHCRWNSLPSKPYQNTNAEGSVYVASGLLWKYAGSKFIENEFFHGPRALSNGYSPTIHGETTSPTLVSLYTRLLLHFDTTPLSDSSHRSHPVTTVNSPGISGVGSINPSFDDYLLLNGVDQHAYVPGGSSSDFSLGADNFGISTWIYPLSLAGTSTIFAHANASNISYALSVTSTQVRFTYYYNGGGLSDSILELIPLDDNGDLTIKPDKWTKVCVTRNGDRLHILIDGYPLLSPSGFGISNRVIGNSAATQDLCIGASPITGVSEFFHGRIDEFRVVNIYSPDIPASTLAENVPYSGQAIGSDVFAPVGGLELGKYSYYFNYFWQDSTGQGHYSESTQLFSGGDFYLPSNNQAPEFRIYGIQLTNHRDIFGDSQPNDNYETDAVIHVWRTPVDQISGSPALVGSIEMSDNKRYYSFRDDPPFLEGDSPGMSLDFPQSFKENANVTAIGKEDPTFRIAPECPVGICYHRDHLVISTTKNVIWSSKPVLENFTASFTSAGLNQSNSYHFSPTVFERTSHVASTGNTLYCFTPNDVYAYFGDGPNSAGEGSYSGPELVGPSMGIRPTGFASRIPDGVIYQAQGGYYLLQGKGRPVYFGSSVSDFEGEVPVGIAVSDENQHILIGIGGASRTILVYNWVYQIWSTWGFDDPASVMDLAGVSNYVQENGENRLYILGKSGSIWKQKTRADANPWRDSLFSGGISDYEYTPEVVTSWMQFPLFHHSARIYRSNVLFSAGIQAAADLGTLEVKTYVDWVETPVSTHTLVVNTGTGASEPLEMIVKPTRQKCKSFKMGIQIKDSGAEPILLDGLAFLVGERNSKEAFEASSDMESTVT